MTRSWPGSCPASRWAGHGRTRSGMPSPSWPRCGRPAMWTLAVTRPCCPMSKSSGRPARPRAPGGRRRTREAAMASLGFWRRAELDPEWIAAVDTDGTPHNAGDLLGRVNQLTHGLRSLGLRPGDGIAAVLPNGIAPLEVSLAALQGGWYFTPINWHFTPPEIAYIAADCEAKAFFVAERFAAAGAAAADAAGVPA